MSETRKAGAFGWIHLFFLVIIVVAGSLFIYKLYTFLETVWHDEMAGFAFDPIVVYSVVALGFFLLLAWAYLTGQLKDIEQPKYDMLEQYEKLEARDVALLQEGKP